MTNGAFLGLTCDTKIQTGFQWNTPAPKALEILRHDFRLTANHLGCQDDEDPRAAPLLRQAVVRCVVQVTMDGVAQLPQPLLDGTIPGPMLI